MEARDLIADLLAGGMTQTVIAARTGIPQPTISKVATGRVADVLSANYRKLQALHAAVVGAKGGAAQAADRATR